MNNLLDLTLTTYPDIVKDLEIQPGMSGHCVVTYDIGLSVKRHKKPDHCVYQYKKVIIIDSVKDMYKFKDKFLSGDFLQKSVDHNWNLFKNSLSKSTRNHIPQKKITSHWNLPWFAKEIRRLCQRKIRAWKLSQQNRNSYYWKRYLELSKKVKHAIESAQRDYFDNLLNTSVSENPEKFYSYINQKSFIPILIRKKWVRATSPYSNKTITA